MSEERMVMMRPMRVYLICDCGGEMRRIGGSPSDIAHQCILCGTTAHTGYCSYPYTKYVPEPNSLADYICHKDKKGRCVRPAPWPEELVGVSPDMKKFECRVCKCEVVPPEQAAHELPEPPVRECKDHPDAPLSAGKNPGEWSCAICGRSVGT